MYILRYGSPGKVFGHDFPFDGLAGFDFVGVGTAERFVETTRRRIGRCGRLRLWRRQRRRRWRRRRRRKHSVVRFVDFRSSAASRDGPPECRKLFVRPARRPESDRPVMMVADAVHAAFAVAHPVPVGHYCSDLDICVPVVMMMTTVVI